MIVRDMLCGDRAMNTAGIILPVGRERRPELVRLHYHATLADEEALSSMLGLKGAWGLVPCARHEVLVRKEKRRDADRGLRPIVARTHHLLEAGCK